MLFRSLGRLIEYIPPSVTLGFTGGIEEIDGYEGASRESSSSAPSFTRRATSETGCVMVESSPDMPEISVEVEKF